MKLFWTPASPFTRKVSVAAKEIGLWDKIEIIQTKWPLSWGYETVQFTAGLAENNPVARIPTLVTDAGYPLGCSTLACQHLDRLSGGRLSGPDPDRMWSLYAIADGLIEAQILMRAEHLRPREYRMESFLQKQRDRITRCFDAIEARADELQARNDGNLPNLAEITVAIAASYQDWREWLEDFRPGRPSLTSWYESFRMRPSMQTTEPAETPEA
ncbi:MAG: glutathione S-transferase N-terminal domain-containing protein [Rhodospirillales bacterium]